MRFEKQGALFRMAVKVGLLALIPGSAPYQLCGRFVKLPVPPFSLLQNEEESVICKVVAGTISMPPDLLEVLS